MSLNHNSYEFMGEEGIVYSYTESTDMSDFQPDKPEQTLLNSYELIPLEGPSWGSSTEFHTDSYKGKCIKYVLELSHPFIHFAKIIEKIYMIINGEEIQSIDGRALLIYNDMYHPRYLEQNMMALPFMHYGASTLANIEEKICNTAVFRVALNNNSNESNIQYAKMLKHYIGNHIIPDLACDVLSYLGVRNEESDTVNLTLHIYTERTFGVTPVLYQVHRNLYVNCLSSYEYTIPCNVKCHMSLMIPYNIPISQICVAFWKTDNFPKFIPHLSHINFDIKNMFHIESNSKKSLIMDKLQFNIHYDSNNPIYTITFSDPSILEDKGMTYYNGVADYHTAIRSLPLGTLFGGIHSKIHMSVSTKMSVDQTSITMGVWAFGVNRYQFYDYYSTPRPYMFKKEMI